jgi:hypothetical protein
MRKGGCSHKYPETNLTFTGRAKTIVRDGLIVSEAIVYTAVTIDCQKCNILWRTTHHRSPPWVRKIMKELNEAGGEE